MKQPFIKSWNYSLIVGCALSGCGEMKPNLNHVTTAKLKAFSKVMVLNGTVPDGNLQPRDLGLVKENAVDGWGRTIDICKNNGVVYFRSAGNDGSLGSNDDIIIETKIEDSAQK